MAYMSQEKKKALAPAIKAILKEYDLKGTLSVEHHSGLVLTIKSGKIDFFAELAPSRDGFGGVESAKPTYLQVNTYHIDSHYVGKAKEVLAKLKAAMSVGNHDNSDIQSDHFDVGWYVYINVGKWDHPYVLEA